MTAKARKVFLIRHGETEFNRLGVFRGRFEVPLNDSGRRQAEETGNALSEHQIQVLYTSPLKRAVETTKLIAGVIGVEYLIDDSFNNIALGERQGVEKEKIKQGYPDMWKLWMTEPEKLKIPGGETVGQVQKRAFSRLLELVSEQGQNFGIVTHRSVIKTLAASLLNVPAPYFWKFYIDNAAYSVFGYDRSMGFSLLTWNNNAHLSEKVVEVF